MEKLSRCLALLNEAAKRQKEFDSLHTLHVNALQRQGKADTTIVRRITEYFDACPDRLTQDQLKNQFGDPVKSHSCSTVKLDRNGLPLFYHHVLNKQWQWVDVIKPP